MDTVGAATLLTHIAFENTDLERLENFVGIFGMSYVLEALSAVRARHILQDFYTARMIVDVAGDVVYLFRLVQDYWQSGCGRTLSANGDPEVTGLVVLRDLCCGVDLHGFFSWCS